MVYTGSCCLGNARRYKQGASFSLGVTLELCEELLDSSITWTVPDKEPLTDQDLLLGFWTTVPR